MKSIKRVLIFVAIFAACTNLTNAQNLGDLFNKAKSVVSGGSSNTTNTVGNLLQGLFSNSDIKVEDMTGVWTANGSAVTFKGEGFLKQAGGAAAAATVKTKLDPYYKKYGLTGAVLTIKKDGQFELKIKKVVLKGTVEATSEKGVFNFKFQAFNNMNLGTVKTYVQKTSSTMDVMFDATKLMKIVETVGNVTNISIAKTFSSLLSQYDGMCVGFSTTLTSSKVD